MGDTRVYEVMLSVSRGLEDPTIDESIGSREIYGVHVDNRVVTVCGRREGRAIRVRFEDWTDSVELPQPPPERRMLEVFAAQPRVTLDATCRRRTIGDDIGRVIGLGGRKGEHRLFESTRIDASSSSDTSCLDVGAFADALERTVARPECRRVELHEGAGVAPILEWTDTISADEIAAWITAALELAATLDT